jgi:hypothetical protein
MRNRLCDVTSRELIRNALETSFGSRTATLKWDTSGFWPQLLSFIFYVEIEMPSGDAFSPYDLLQPSFRVVDPRQSFDRTLELNANL